MTKRSSEGFKPLKGPDRIRKRPEVMFGSNNEDGALEVVKVLILCSVDEVALGYADKITIILHSDKSVTISDNGRGIFVQNSDGSDKAWQKRFTELCGYPENCESAPGWLCGNKIEEHEPFVTDEFLFMQMHLCAAQYVCSYMDVVIHRDQKQYDLCFKKGKNHGGLKSVKSTKSNGTMLHFMLDNEVFTNINISHDDLAEYLRNIAAFHNNLKIELIDKRNNPSKSTYFCYSGGIEDYLEEHVSGQLIAKPVKSSFKYESELGSCSKSKNELEIILAFAEKGVLQSLHNYQTMNYGSTVNDNVEFVTNWINKYLSNAYFISDEKDYSTLQVKKEDVREKMCLVIISRSQFSCYTNPVKKGLNDDVFAIFVKRALERMLSEIFPRPGYGKIYSEAKGVLDAIIKIDKS